MRIIAEEVFIYLRLFVFDYKALLICVTDKTCLIIATTAFCFNIFKSIFGPLFYLLDRKLILGSKPI